MNSSHYPTDGQPSHPHWKTRRNTTTNADPYQTVLERLATSGCDPKTVDQGKAESRCPAHKGDRHNLVITRGDQGKVLLHCHAGCSAESIVLALGLGMKDLFASPSSDNTREPAKSLSPAKKLSTNAPRPIADKETLDKVYRAFLSLLTLNPEHRAQLVERGLDDATIDQKEYRSYGFKNRTNLAASLVEMFGRETVLGVPGFIEKSHGNVTIKGSAGTLIPVRRPDGAIRALKVRQDNPEDGPKYLYLSSSKPNDDEIAGPSPGAPAHFPRGMEGPSDKWTLTEGEFKADVVHHFTAGKIASMPGVSSWRTTLDEVIAQGAKTIRLAFDADAITNRNVAKALLDCALAIVEQELNLVYLHWDVADAKGLDDLLSGGGLPQVLVGSQAIDAIRATAIKAGVDVPETVPPLRLSEQVQVIIAAGGLEALYRSGDTLKMLALASLDELSAIKVELKRHKGFSIREFDKLLKQFKPSKTGDNFVARSTYDVVDGGFVLVGQDKDGNEQLIALSNFEAKIAIEEWRDNGDERVARFKIEGQDESGGRLEADVSAKDFGSLAWVLPQFGSKAIIAAGQGTKEHVRAAIQEWRQGERTNKTVYTRTGWKEFDNKWSYLHSGGAIGQDGLNTSIQVDLKEHGLTNYELPPPPVGNDLRIAVRASLNIARLAQATRPRSQSVAALILALVYRTVFGSVRFSIQFNGPTGSHKSCAAALAQQHFGCLMNYGNLPAGFNSTSNALQAARHALADSLFTVDDFVPGGSKQEREKANSAAEDLFRTQGNGQGRHRMNLDQTLRPPMDPKSALLTTGEDRPTRASANLRTLGEWFEKDDASHGSLGTIDKTVLGECQADADAGLYASSMSAFIQWVAPRYRELRDSIPRKVIEYRQLATQPGDHGRTPDIIAELTAGFEIFLEFAVETKAITPGESVEYFKSVWDGLMASATAMREEMSEQGDPAEKFIQTIGSALSSKHAYLVDSATGDIPSDDDMLMSCGWYQDIKYQGTDIGSVPIWIHGPNAKQIGWIENERVYLDPTASYSMAQQIIKDQSETFPSQVSLARQLDTAHKLVEKDSRPGQRRLTARKSLAKKQRNVWAIKASEFWPDETSDQEPTPLRVVGVMV